MGASDAQALSQGDCAKTTNAWYIGWALTAFRSGCKLRRRYLLHCKAAGEIKEAIASIG